MKKILPIVKSFVLMFVLHFSLSLLVNQFFQDNESVGATAVTSLLVAVLFYIFSNLFGKTKKEHKTEDA